MDKLAHIASTYAEETIHPYYDNIDDVQWLAATVNYTKPASFSFRVVPPATWTVDLASRVKTHLRVFKLYSLYSSHAAEELSNINKQIRDLFNNGGANAVKDHIKEGLDSRLEANKNSWATAMYAGMYEDVWFHTNGFF